MSEIGTYTKNQVISILTKSQHGKLEDYTPVANLALEHDPEFLAHLISWDRINGQVRDSKVALPVLSLGKEDLHPEFVENSFGHLYRLNPRELLKAYRFALKVRPKRMRKLKKLVERFLRKIESESRDLVLVRHRAVLKELYALTHTKPDSTFDKVLFKNEYPEGSIFDLLKKLGSMSSKEAAGTILEKKIPFLAAAGALGSKIKDPDVVLALLETMTPTEVVTNSKMLTKLDVFQVPALRAAYDIALQKAADSKKATFKTTRAAQAAEASGDERTAKKLKDLQEAQLDALKGIEGNWLVLADKSGSMERAIDIGRQVAATLARMVAGNVYLVFFDAGPRFFDVSKKTYDEVLALTKHVSAAGGTSIGCGLLYALDSNFDIDGIAIISDGGENTLPSFNNVYERFSTKIGKEVPVYFYRLAGDPDTFSRSNPYVQIIEIIGADYYSLPNLVKTMRANRYSLVQEVMDTPLLRFSF